MRTQQMQVAVEVRAFLRQPHGRPNVPCVIKLGWRADDPLAVSMEAGETRWLFGRQLLHAGCLTKVGDGDVVVWPEAQNVVISLRSTSRADLVMSRTAVRHFVTATARLVPLGQENVDDELDQWLADLTEDQ